MNLSTSHKTLCMFTCIILGACDPEVDGVDLAAIEAAELHLAEDVEEDDAPSYSPSDEHLAVSESLDPVGASECLNIQIEFREELSGVCGGCLINGAYPGQKELTYGRACKNNQWGPWQVYLTDCNDC